MTVLEGSLDLNVLLEGCYWLRNIWHWSLH